MSLERPTAPETEEEQLAPFTPVSATPQPVPDGRSSLASLLDITDEDLAEPLARAIGSTESEMPVGEMASAEPALFAFDDVSEAAIFADVHLDASAGFEPLEGVEPTVETVIHGPIGTGPIPTGSAPVSDETPESTWSIPAEAIASANASSNLPARIVNTPSRPPAIAVPPETSRRRRHKSEPPVAEFGRTDVEAGAVLWPSQRASRTPIAPREVCAKCGGQFEDGKCESCGYAVSVAARVSRRGKWRTIVSAFVDSDSRLLRTIGALLLAPGELTVAFISGDRRRFCRPAYVGVMALLLFGAISFVGGLRPRPDRALVIGSERTQELVAGLADPNSGYSDDGPRTISNTVLSSLEGLPVLFLPLMGLTVFAIIGTSRSFSKRENPWAAALATHISAWFVVWWGVAVPIILLVLKFAFEYKAAMNGVTTVRYDIDQLEGVPAWWNLGRSIITSRAFHSLLLLSGLVPYTAIAYRWAFSAPWWRAILLGSLIAFVPIFMLFPFV
jgi:hypothetical protein